MKQRQFLDAERCSKSEEGIADLISCIHPNQPMEKRGNVVVVYMDQLITKCFPCQLKCISGVEARGLKFGPSIALAIGAKFVPLRKCQPKAFKNAVLVLRYDVRYFNWKLHNSFLYTSMWRVRIDNNKVTSNKLCIEAILKL